MGGQEEVEEKVMKINIGLAEILLMLLTVIMSIGGSWIAVKEQMAVISESNRVHSKLLEEYGGLLRTNQVEMALAVERYHHLSRSNDDYKQSIEGLRGVLSQLNNTLARVDERLKGLEDGVKGMSKSQ